MTDSSTLSRATDDTPVPPYCRCAACLALWAEAGGTLAPFLASKLLVRGWAGQVTDSERAFQVAHAPWMSRAILAGRRAAQAGKLVPRNPGRRSRRLVR